jgi:tetratricopeptide (TPR) repeat protein
MHNRNAALLALGGLALGLVLGRGFDVLQDSQATNDIPPGAAVRSLPEGHPQIGDRSLNDAVVATMRMRNASLQPTAPAAWGAGNAGGAQSSDLVTQADELRRQRKFNEAVAVYRRLVAAGDMTADAWADYADALASASSSLKGEPANAVVHALELDPRHAKALWLKASLEHEERQYADAVRTWQALLAVVPKDSSDARIIEANIAEASRLATSPT